MLSLIFIDKGSSYHNKITESNYWASKKEFSDIAADPEAAEALVEETINFVQQYASEFDWFELNFLRNADKKNLAEFVWLLVTPLEIQLEKEGVLEKYGISQDLHPTKKELDRFEKYFRNREKIGSRFFFTWVHAAILDWVFLLLPYFKFMQLSKLPRDYYDSDLLIGPYVYGKIPELKDDLRRLVVNDLPNSNAYDSALWAVFMREKLLEIIRKQRNDQIEYLDEGINKEDLIIENSKIQSDGLLEKSIIDQSSAIALFLDFSKDEKFSSDKEVILTFIIMINEDYANDSFLTEWVDKHIAYAETLGEKLQQKVKEIPDHIINQMNTLFTQYSREAHNSEKSLYSRLTVSDFSKELNVFLRKNNIDWMDVYGEVMSQFVKDLYRQIRPATANEISSIPQSNSLINAPADEIISDSTQIRLDVDGDSEGKFNSMLTQNFPIIKKLFKEKADDLSDLVLQDDKKLSDSDNDDKSHTVGRVSYKNQNVALLDKVKAQWTSSPKTKAPLVIAGSLLSAVIIISFFIFSGEVPAINDMKESTQGEPFASVVKPLAYNPVNKDNEVSKPVNFSVSSAVMAKKLDLNFDPQLVANSFPSETRPLYYYFIYNGSISDRILEAQIYQNDTLHSSYQQQDFQYSSNAAWLAIDSNLSPGEWLVRLYSDNKLVNIIPFSILSNVLAESSRVTKEEKQKEQTETFFPTPRVEPIISKAEKVDEPVKDSGENDPEPIAELTHTQKQVELVENRHSGPPKNLGEEVAAVTSAVPNVTTRNKKADSQPISLSQKNARLFVFPMPLNSRIRVLNIKPKYNYGIELPAGDYHLEISATGHQTIKKWISIKQGENKHLSFELTPDAKQAVEITGSGDSELDILLTMIESSDVEEMRTAAKILASNYYDNNFALDKAEQVLLANYESSSNSWTSNDALSYLCKMLGASKQQRFQETLMLVGHHGNSFILMWHAQWSASALD